MKNYLIVITFDTEPPLSKRFIKGLFIIVIYKREKQQTYRACVHFLSHAQKADEFLFPNDASRPD